MKAAFYATLMQTILRLQKKFGWEILNEIIYNVENWKIERGHDCYISSWLMSGR